MNNGVLTLDGLVERDESLDLARRPAGEAAPRVKVVAVADLPTRYGTFKIVAFENDRDGKEHVAIVKGDVVGASGVPLRVHSECLTGDALGSQRCDCRDQLEASLRKIASLPLGIVLYMRQEGRGIGLANKIRAYQLQDGGLDTVDANLALGFHDDERRYDVAAALLHSLNVASVRLMTNNPKKLAGLREHGVAIEDRIAHVMSANDHNRAYLRTKAERSGHLIGYPRAVSNEPTGS